MNPLYNTNDSPNNSTQPTKAVNRQGVYVPRTHNTFDMSYFNYMTQRFGEYNPFFAMEAVPGDKIPLHSSHNVRSFTMSSPFLSSLTLNKDYFCVPMQAIMPKTWEYIYKLPSQGDDVPDDANCLCPLFSLDTDINVITRLFDFTQNSSEDIKDKFRMLFVLELFLSQGSLLSNMGYHLNPRITNSTNSVDYSFDEWFDGVIRALRLCIVNYDGNNYIYNEDVSPSANSNVISKYQLLSMLRKYGSECQIVNVGFDEESDFYNRVTISALPSWSSSEDFGTDVNISRLLAYQVACAQFYVNPQIDYIYNSQLYLDNLFTLWSAYLEDFNPNLAQVKYFDYNGIKVPYDYASKAYFVTIFDEIVRGEYHNIGLLYDYLNAIFGHRESLKFGDYFTDSRTRPLAIGDNNVEVNAEGVDVIDISKSIVLQRFRNAVVKLGNNFGDYLRGIFGTEPSPDYHFPKFISHSDFDINGFEVANTSSTDQGNLVTNLRAGDERFAFEVEIDMPCIIIGMSYFSVPRAYMQTKERHFFHRDRFDMFNTALQNIGDQIVYNHERTDLRPNDEIFGYQSRNNEYKQRYSVVSGGFATKLPAWTFVGDSLFNPLDYKIIENTQSPEYIRAHDYEFNRFFAQLSGYSLANHFHFIVVYNNQCVANRPMEINPSIL